MKYLPVIALLLSLTFCRSFCRSEPLIPIPQNATGVEVILVDTGLSKPHSGILNMPATAAVTDRHGANMANNFENQLILEHAKPVNAKEVVWMPGALETEIDALHQAVVDNPRVISMSLSGKEWEPEEYKLVEDACKRGILIIAASGNDNPSRNEEYPAAYPSPCIIGVGSLKGGMLAPWSNKGQIWMNYVEGDPYGTSSSTARMAAIAIVYFQKHPTATYQEAKDFLTSQYSLTAHFLRRQAPSPFDLLEPEAPVPIKW